MTTPAVPGTPGTPAAPGTSAAPDELEPVATSVARVILGALLMIVTGALAIALFVYYIAHDFLPGGDVLGDFGDGLLYGAIFGFVGAVTGFEIMRRGIKRRKEEAANTADIVQRVQTAQANGTLTEANLDAIVDGPTGENGSNGLPWDGPQTKG